MGSARPLRGLLTGLAGVAIAAVLAYAFSTSLYLDIPLPGAAAFTIGDLVVTAAYAILAAALVGLAGPLSLLYGEWWPRRSRPLSILTHRLLQLAALAVVYLGLRPLGVRALAIAIPGRAGTVYDALFLVAAALVAYMLVKDLS